MDTHGYTVGKRTYTIVELRYGGTSTRMYELRSTEDGCYILMDICHSERCAKDKLLACLKTKIHLDTKVIDSKSNDVNVMQQIIERLEASAAPISIGESVL